VAESASVFAEYSLHDCGLYLWGGCLFVFTVVTLFSKSVPGITSTRVVTPNEIDGLGSSGNPNFECHSFALLKDKSFASLEDRSEERSKPVLSNVEGPAPSRGSGQALSRAKGRISLLQGPQEILRYAQNDIG
jgi:hypothetical protein